MLWILLLLLAGAGAKRITGVGPSVLVIQLDGSVFGTGSNAHGQLGVGSPIVYLPERMVGVTNASAVCLGAFHSCVVDQTVVRCTGTLGGNVLTTATQVFCGGSTSFALQSASSLLSSNVLAWGEGTFGKLGLGSYLSQPSPMRLAGIDGAIRVVDVAAGLSHSCLVTEKGAAYCMGWNYYGQLGNGEGGELVNKIWPTRVQASPFEFASMGCGAFHTCAITTANSGQVLCWGRSNYGQLGLGGSVLVSHLPQVVQGLRDAHSVWTGVYNSFIVQQNGTVWAFGGNADGVLGDGSTKDKSKPVQFGLGIKQVVGGQGSTCVLLALDGVRVQCLGANSFGQFGVGRGLSSSLVLVDMQLPGATNKPTNKPTRKKPTRKKPTKKPTRKKPTK
ncbi:hypothetical protein BASA81_006763 [Batrachochytrium salamandrivorans]|nr:hypothetical protein BASA81_006763 [Batrachochytrium salamandrivorans]